MEAYLVSGNQRILETVSLTWHAVLLERRYDRILKKAALIVAII